MKLFRKYLKQRQYYILTGVLFALVFVISFALYHIPLKYLIYPLVLCILAAVIIICIDYARVKRKHQRLTTIRTFANAGQDELPEIRNIDDEDYQEIIRLLCAEHEEFSRNVAGKSSEMREYYAIWAHQIKTPIASMRLRLQNEDSELSRTLSADLFRIEQYVEMVMTYLRLDSSSTDYIIKQYDLDGIVKCAVKKFSREFIGKRINLIYEPLNVAVLTDEKWLSFVIEQVLSNALKYTMEGSIEIVMEPENKLIIKDTGIGIAKEDIPRIFENGYTGSNGRLDKRASGIGLYLCKRICHNLGHEISARSEIGQGTEIVIDLGRRPVEVE